jgi:hypothetical protein
MRKPLIRFWASLPLPCRAFDSTRESRANF